MSYISRIRLTKNIDYKYCFVKNESFLSLSFILLTFLCVFLCQPISGADDVLEADRPIPLLSVEGVLSQAGKLPCDVRVPNRNDKLHMVLWFRDNGEPIYRYDVRERSETKRWSELGERVFFNAMSEPAHLLISGLRREDEGVYRCRVDFKNSPTRNLRINLTIIEPPNSVVIFDSNSNAPDSGKVGPYNEGSELLLSCHVYGGRPKPKVTWWLENGMIDDTSDDRSIDFIVNHLKYSPLNRNHLNARFVCQASNTNQTLPISSFVILNLNLRPLTVSITTKDANLVADKRYDIECISTGSRPAAAITWWKNGRQVKKSPLTPVSTPEDKNITRSILTLIPSIDDDGKFLSCISENPHIPNSEMEDRWRLHVHYAPKVSLQLGSSLIADEIKEGIDVYFECTVKSNPPYKRLSWFHDDREIRHNASQRIIMSNTRLILQKLTRHSAGNYYCTAANSEGLSQSNVVQLRVKFVPICKSNKEEVVGASLHETISVRCEMSSDPPDVKFHWTFTRLGLERSSIPNPSFTSNGTTSTLRYTPASDSKFGTLSCWGANSIGHGESSPCHFQIVHASRPSPPKNCSVFNETEYGLTLSCEEGFNGGLAQSFNLEIYDTLTKMSKLNISSEVPLFEVKVLESDVPYKFIIVSNNSKGRSESFILHNVTFQGVAKPLGSTGVGAEMSPVFTILVICSILLFIFIILTLVTIWKRARRKKIPVVVKATLRRDSENIFESPEEDITPTKLDQNGIEDIGDPDVIPSKNGGGLRSFIRIHKTPPARRRKKNLEVKQNGETIALTEHLPELELNGRVGTRASLLLSSTSIGKGTLPRESRI